MPNPEGRPTNVIERAIDNYKKIRDILFRDHSDKAVDSNGKISDLYFMACIIGAEFGDYSGEAARMEALEALSNQYRRQSGFSNMLCFGDCKTIETQLAWSTDVQAIYDGTLVEKMTSRKFNMDVYLDYAGMAKAGYKHGARSEAWMWGNVNDNELDKVGDNYFYNDHWVIERDVSQYDNTRWFIVWSDWLELKLQH